MDISQDNTDFYETLNKQETQNYSDESKFSR